MRRGVECSHPLASVTGDAHSTAGRPPARRHDASCAEEETMTRSSRFVSGVAAVALAPFLALSLLASAQSADPASRPYRLDSRATFQKGCFAPCMCPVMMQGPLRGTFRLTPTGTSGDYSTWDVTDVNWKAFVAGGSELRITGSGTYRR